MLTVDTLDDPKDCGVYRSERNNDNYALVCECD